MNNKILIIDNVDEGLTHGTRGQDLRWVAHEFDCGRVHIVGSPGHHTLTLTMGVIVGVRWPYYVVLRGPLLGMKEPKVVGYMGHVAELGETLLAEMRPR